LPITANVDIAAMKVQT